MSAPTRDGAQRFEPRHLLPSLNAALPDASRGSGLETRQKEEWRRVASVGGSWRAQAALGRWSGLGPKNRCYCVAVEVSSTHPDYEASALEWSRIWDVTAGEDPLKQAGVKRYARTIFSGVFGEVAPVFAVIRWGFLGQAVRRKTCARVSRMNGILATSPP